MFLHLFISMKNNIILFCRMQPQQPEPSHRRINVVQLIREVLEQCPEKKTLIFTDLCPIRITNRKYAISAMLALLG